MKDFTFGGGGVIPFDKRKTSSSGKASTKFLPRCYEKHPAMSIPGTDKVVYGGSCSTPIVTDADIYIGFDGSMRMQGRRYPWNDQHEILHVITDQKPPSNAKEFTALAAWTLSKINDGRKVHCGCIGGHGRTGTFLAALAALSGEKDAIEYVRAHYCDKAVETPEQVDFLVKTYGIKPAKARHTFSHTFGGKGSFKSSLGAELDFEQDDFDFPRKTGERYTDLSIANIQKKTIWGRNPIG